MNAPLSFNKCIPQGGTESPELWNQAMYYILAPLVHKWHVCSYGIHIGNNVVLSHWLWADNLFLVVDDK